jgi:hypothetical protein
VSADIHTSNAFRGYALGRLAHERGAFVVFGGIHATFPDEAHQDGAAHSVVRGDGDIAWGEVLEDCASGRMKPVYEGGRIAGAFRAARWDLLPRKRYRSSSICSCKARAANVEDLESAYVSCESWSRHMAARLPLTATGCLILNSLECRDRCIVITSGAAYAA